MENNNLPITQEERALISLEAAEKEIEPIDVLNQSVVDFGRDILDMVKDSYKNTAWMSQDLRESYPEFSPDQKITLYSVERNAQNDQLAKILPTLTGTVHEQKRIKAQPQQMMGPGGTNIQINAGNGGNSNGQLLEQALGDAPPKIKNFINVLYQLSESAKQEAEKSGNKTE